jgi:hypothetical protein
VPSVALDHLGQLKGEFEDRDGSDIRACTEKWWVVSDATLDGYADELMAVADNDVADVFTRDIPPAKPIVPPADSNLGTCDKIESCDVRLWRSSVLTHDRQRSRLGRI